MDEAASDLPPAIKDEHDSHPIPGAWRPLFQAVVKRFVAGDYGLEAGVAGVEPVSAKTVDQIRRYIDAYGATLVELPQESWRTSVAQWYGTHWDVLVDLWTAEEGSSDLVLSGRVVETDDGPRFSIYMVYVP